MIRQDWPAMGCGAGLRNKHYSFILSEWPQMDWFEAVTENFMDTGGRPLATLERIRAHYPLALHGVSLSIGSMDPLDADYLKKLKSLTKRIDPFVVSDHLCWTGVGGENLHDLLPLPLTEEAVSHVVRRVDEVQTALGRPILLENISTYVTYKHSAMPEWEFLREVARRSGCGILLDLNNIYVNSFNHGFDPALYLEEIPAKWVGQFHLAGHSDKGAFLFDTHGGSVADKVWQLYRRALELYGSVSTLIEWDEAIPNFKRLSAEVKKAKTLYNVAPSSGSGTVEFSENKLPSKNTLSTPSLLETQRQMKERILVHRGGGRVGGLLNKQGGANGEERMAVYADAYVARMMEALGETYETVKHLLGQEAFVELTESYMEAHPSHSYNLNSVGEHMPEHLAGTRFVEKLPFLPDLARLERQIARSFHAFDGPVFEPGKLAGCSEEDWDRLHIDFQPSVAVVSSRWPVLDIWNERKTSLKDLKIDLENRSQDVLVIRRGLDVHCELVNSLQAELIRSLQRGEALGESCARLADTAETEGLPMGEWFSSWASRGLITRVA